ncbi:hypothetical protein ACFY0F_16460 [Streptomyces sp. NPDC001544]|uniref:hypothetical protein n=1 Tax=Streptomyces sp. NPDC001544 TaxID=3364584 RepID=UPI0036C5524E
MSEPKNRDEHPKTALEEVLHEASRAEKRTTEPSRAEERRGEAGEAITPNTRAEEESQGE